MLTGRRYFTWEGEPVVVLPPLPPRYGKGGKQLSTLAKLSSVGIEFAISTVIGLLGGRWVDEKLGTSPWLMILGLFVGVTAGLRSLIRTARQANREANQSAKPPANQSKASETSDDD
ncbi:MAG: hypothetical protein RL701_1930 [Pseudomonadota bacterium]|jgi:F0F1-type ATP synthase assembly protein I